MPIPSPEQMPRIAEFQSGHSRYLYNKALPFLSYWLV